MKVVFDTNAASFLDNAKPYLLKKPSLHSMILGVATACAERTTPPVILARLVDKNQNTVAAAIQSDPGRGLLLSDATREQTLALANTLTTSGKKLWGVHGPTPIVDEFANTWSTLNKATYKLAMNLRLFELLSLTPAPRTAGSWRHALASDEEFIIPSLIEFAKEAVPHDPPQTLEALQKATRLKIAKQQLFIWQNAGEPVCLVGSSRETPSERWIAPVYTPISFRGRGYGTALVAAVSQLIVDSGKKGMLFTDLANPASNSIYQKIGYSPIADFKLFVFT